MKRGIKNEHRLLETRVWLFIIFLSGLAFSATVEKTISVGESIQSNGLNFTLLDYAGGTALVKLEAANGSSASSVFFVEKNSSFTIAGTEFAFQEAGGGKRLKVTVSFNESTPKTLSTDNRSVEETVSTISTLPAEAPFCVEQRSFGITVEKTVETYYGSAGNVFSRVEFKLKNTGANESRPFVLKDFSSGKEFHVESIGPFGQKTISFITEGVASASEKPSLQPAPPEENPTPPGLFYLILLLIITVEAAIAWRILKS
ncbi:MAG: hypothetical protein V1717_01955 [Candidatus Micrarchaeota archaeon]